MILKQFYLRSLGHASYLIASEKTGEALILDPRRDIDIYFAKAREQGLRIRYVADTHQHNDYVTGSVNLLPVLRFSFFPGWVPSSVILHGLTTAGSHSRIVPRQAPVS
jgi:glyoxylase-like metal-dependent hydrolase (beta-lactamase superfamily II)